MSSFNEKERKIAAILSSYPRVKNALKLLYSFSAYILNKKPFSHNVKLEMTQVLKYGKNETFFGYYDKSPENDDGLILVYSTNIPTRKSPDIRHPLTINVVDQKGNVIVNTTTNSYNWQQGARAQWISNNEFIFNDYDLTLTRYVARIYSLLERKIIKSYNYPVQDAFDKKYFLSLNYQRLMAYRPDYGYRNIKNPTFIPSDEQDGIWHMDMTTGQEKLIISMKQLLHLGQLPLDQITHHKVNHVMISPNGDKFIFLHRYYINKKRFDRLILSNASGEDLTILLDHGMVSHCCWKGNANIICYAKGPKQKTGYWKIDLEDFSLQNIKLTPENLGDGHPHSQNNIIITDSYPDKSRMQQLIIYNEETNQHDVVGHFYHSIIYSGESRCDLHPRFSKAKQHIYIDSIFSGKRQLYKLDLK